MMSWRRRPSAVLTSAYLWQWRDESKGQLSAPLAAAGTGAMCKPLQGIAISSVAGGNAHRLLSRRSCCALTTARPAGPSPQHAHVIAVLLRRVARLDLVILRESREQKVQGLLLLTGQRLVMERQDRSCTQ